MEGWIKIHRQILGSAIFENPNLLKVWIWCLCKATHKPRETLIGLKLVALEAGQFVYGRKAAAKELGFTESAFYKYMKCLESIGMLSLNSNNKFTVATIEKWTSYQSDADKSNSKKTAEEQQSNSKGTAKEQQSNTNKNDKNDKNINNKYIYYGEFENVVLSDEELAKLKAKIPNYEDYIERLSAYMASKGKRYKSHYATILAWSRKDKKGEGNNAGDKRADTEPAQERRMGTYL